MRESATAGVLAVYSTRVACWPESRQSSEPAMPVVIGRWFSAECICLAGHPAMVVRYQASQPHAIQPGMLGFGRTSAGKRGDGRRVWPPIRHGWTVAGVPAEDAGPLRPVAGMPAE